MEFVSKIIALFKSQPLLDDLGLRARAELAAVGLEAAEVQEADLGAYGRLMWLPPTKADIGDAVYDHSLPEVLTGVMRVAEHVASKDIVEGNLPLADAAAIDAGYLDTGFGRLHIVSDADLKGGVKFLIHHSHIEKGDVHLVTREQIDSGEIVLVRRNDIKPGEQVTIKRTQREAGAKLRQVKDGNS